MRRARGASSSSAFALLDGFEQCQQPREERSWRRRATSNVQIDGKNVPRAFDMMLHNDKNTPPVPLIQGPVISIPDPGADEKPTCAICGEKF